jgi:ketosteroid isomerase-like protein
MKKNVFVGLWICILVFTAFSQSPDSNLTLEEGVKKHSGVDGIYKIFSEGYRTLKPELVANIYTEDAAYLSPNEGITNGRKEILANFTGFFNNVKDRGQTMNISFQIFQRKMTKEMGYDVGIYTIDFYKDGKKTGESKGKFVVVAVKGKDKEWRFQVDGYSSLVPPADN